MKYIVKNCPALLNNETIYMECQDETTEHLQCWENEDCKIKKIIKLCNEYKSNYCINNGVHLLIGEILNFLEIEEAE